MHQFRYLVCTLPGWLGSGVAIAATRCGVAGILDLEGTSSDLAQSAVARLRKYRRGPGGIKLDSGSCLRDPEKVRELAKDFELIILTAASRAGVRDLLPLVRERGVTILLESTSEEEAALGAELGVDGLIAKGNEAGGRVGEETTFVLLQRLLKKFRLPIWAHGGIGLHTVGACFAAGAAGVVLDNQLALTSESNLPTKTRAAIERMEGDETLCLGGALGETYRVYKRPGVAAIDELQRLEQELREQPSAELAQERWREAIWSRVGWSRPESNILPLGQDAAFAKHLAEKFHDVSGIVGALRKSVESHVRAAQNLLLLERGAALARSHKTEYPILQGPMTRVSDTAGFAVAVAEGGALPFLALALMRAPQVRSLLSETKQRLGDRPWGVGILGFVPLDLRTEQLEVVREFRPPYAIIAGGRPDQAASLEREGIAAYLHVPAPGLLQVFLDAGARRFIFEGRECGGHVGPRTSFVLWETMIEVLLEAVENGIPAEELHVVFAGGIHDARSAAMVSTMTAPLAERGVRIGVLMGTAYLFTEEAVRSNAIVEGFRQEAIECTRTVLLDSGPGHSTRCADTPFFRVFQETKRKLIAAGKSSDDIRETLENLNLGRLRIASKGIARDPQDPRDQPRYIKLSPEQQQLEGMYMIGQLAALRNQTCTIRDLHEDVTSGGARLLRDLSLPAELLSKPVDRPAPKPADIAIVGMGCLLPGAKDVKTFWKNVLNKVDSIREIPLERFDHKLYFDADKKAQDKIYSKWGGFLDDIDFDPMRYGIPPAALSSIDPFQLLSLEVVHQALGDAGYLKRDFPHQRTSVIFGLSGGLGNLGLQYSVRSLLPIYFGQVPPELRDRLPEWTEDSFAGLLLNVAPGRVANRFDFGGVNYAVDAACASSLAAVQLAIRELEIGTSDMVVVGGVDTTQNAFGYLCFAKSQALSARGRCSTFDEGADGIAIGEGLVTLVLKRLADAEHDGDRIYAVIKSVAGSSDGRGKGLTAPRPEGQVLALQRAYQQAGVSPASIGLVEAHGTGTVAGDAAEVASLTEVYGAAGAKPASCAIGSVKSMIGHTKASAGVVGLMKVALALYHKVLPPTLNVEMPNAMLRQPDCPFFVNTEPLPWVPASTDVLRRASVSSFGFGGTNFHAVVEEYEGDYGNPADKATTEEWPTELFYWNAASSADLQISLKSLEDSLQGGSALSLRDLAASIYADSQAVTEPGARLAIVASSIGDLLSKIAAVQKALSAGETVVPGVRGVYLGQGRAQLPKLAFLFSGQGSQYPGMLRDLALHFPEIRGSLDVANRIQGFKFPRPLSSYVYPPPAFTPAEREARMQAITDTTIAQPALGAVEVGLVHLLKRLGLRPNITAGHSYGEYVALWAAGVWSDEDLFEISAARGRFIKDSIGENPGAMAAVSATRDQVATVLRGNENVWLANFNAPQQIIIAGEVEELRKAAEVLSSQGLTSRPIPVACAFHTPLMQGARDRLGEFIAVKKFSTPTTEVFSNSLAGPYPKQPTEIGSTLREHLVRPVEFVREIEAMYEAGARVFLEVGPKSVLTALVRQILAGKDALAVPIDVADVHGLIQLQHVLGQIAVLGFPVNLDELFRGRATRIVTLGQISTVKPPAPSAWVVNGAGVRLRSGAALSQQRKALTGFPGQGTTKEEKVVAGTAIPAATPLQPEAPGSGLHGIRPKPSPAPAILREGVPNMESQDSISVPGQANGPEAVLIEFQKLMNQFLQTQESVMRAYLQSGSGDSAMVAPANLLSQTLAADTRVVQDLYQPATKPDPSTPSEAPKTPFDETVQAPAADPAAVRDATGELVGIVSARTGYPPEMLDLDLNLEADLGIDSIKRVEILGAFQKACSTDEQSRIQGAMERLTKRKTLRELAGALSEALRNGNSAISDKALPKAAAGADEPQRKDYTTELVGIVSARTGYPPEMLDLDLNLEADLGIDSIKRVEILGAFQKA
ncbi:MAG: acyltransferase domain-containing protein, partial [Acidobacteria bacterium]|nr:acyltransferase domain-containing protein [Acidobacteriota bacterium]